MTACLMKQLLSKINIPELTIEIGFVCWLLLVVAKLVSPFYRSFVSDLPWLWIFIPLWLPSSILLLNILLLALAGIIASFFDHKRIN